jgi:transcriptional regulator with XRE-family HTH domain
MGKTAPQLNSLRLYRRKLGLTQGEAARLIGLKTATSLSHFERFDKLPSLKNAIKLEIILHTPVAFLFRELFDQFRKEIRDRATKTSPKR